MLTLFVFILDADGVKYGISFSLVPFQPFINLYRASTTTTTTKPLIPNKLG
jgi:hypothetical protein